tara:strand:- start:391 stop:564 length:174 start_codon:yes stop_codon:yes gene_type:complete
MENVLMAAAVAAVAEAMVSALETAEVLELTLAVTVMNYASHMVTAVQMHAKSVAMDA